MKKKYQPFTKQEMHLKLNKLISDYGLKDTEDKYCLEMNNY